MLTLLGGTWVLFDGGWGRSRLEVGLTFGAVGGGIGEWEGFLLVVQVHGSTVGMNCRALSGFLALSSFSFLMKVGQFLFQLAWSNVLHEAQ